MRRVLIILAFLVLGGCGSSPPQEAEPVLSTDALPGLEATTEPVSAADLAADFGTDVPVDGFVSGTERVFQGESHDLNRVVSRTLEFESPKAATAYVELVGARVDDLYGVGTTAKPFEEGGRAGYLVDPAACACHRASPTLTGVVSEGSRVTYLEINGDGATPEALGRLLRVAP
jgi:hypothetical protein